MAHSGVKREEKRGEKLGEKREESCSPGRSNTSAKPSQGDKFQRSSPCSKHLNRALNKSAAHKNIHKASWKNRRLTGKISAPGEQWLKPNNIKPSKHNYSILLSSVFTRTFKVYYGKWKMGNIAGN